jgi:hypothetical protein
MKGGTRPRGAGVPALRGRDQAKRHVPGKILSKKSRYFMRANIEREIRERERKQKALLKQWGVTEQELKEWSKQNEVSGREAAYNELVDVELCSKLTGDFARESAKRTGRDIGEIRDRYESIVMEFLAARYARSDGKRVSLATVLRNKYETDEALQKFLPAVSRWLGEYVTAASAEGRAKGSWTMSDHAVGKNLLTALAEEYKRDRSGLICFLSAMFKEWRQLLAPDSGFRAKLLTHQMETGNVKEFAEYLEKIGVVEKNTPAEKLHAKIKQWRSRDRKSALEKHEKVR